MSDLLGRQWGGTPLYHLVTKDVAKAAQRGKVGHIAGLRGFSEHMAKIGAHDRPYARGDLTRGMGWVQTRIRPGATVVHRGEDEEAGDEDITVRKQLWHPDEYNAYDINRPGAVSHIQSAGFDVGKEFARERLPARKLKSWADDEFYHHTSHAAAQDILSRLHHGEPGLLLSRSGDTGPGIYTSADRTAWRHVGSRREHPGWEFAMHLHGVKGIGAGPGGDNSLWGKDPPKIVSARYKSPKSRYDYRSGRGGIDPNFWREHGIDTVVTGGKETLATHPLQVQVLRATDKATGRVHHFNDEVHRHYRPELRVQESDYSPRQERN